MIAGNMPVVAEARVSSTGATDATELCVDPAVGTPIGGSTQSSADGFLSKDPPSERRSERRPNSIERSPMSHELRR